MKTNDGIELTGRTPAELVRELHKMSMSPAADDVQFMDQMAGRCLLQTGKRCRSWPAEDFIADLIAAGILVDE